MTDQIDELIREIAAKHGVAVARDDPILILQTINNRLLLDSAKAQQVQLDAYKEDMENLAQRWGADAREKAERLLKASLVAARETMEEMFRRGAEAAAISIRNEIGLSLQGINEDLRSARKIAIVNIAASGIAILAAAVTLWATLR